MTRPTITLTDPPFEHDKVLYAVSDGEMEHDDHPAPPCDECQWGPPAAWRVPDTCDTCRGEGFTMRELSRTSQEVVWCDCVDGKPLVTIDMPCPTCKGTGSIEGRNIASYDVCFDDRDLHDGDCDAGRVSFPATVTVLPVVQFGSSDDLTTTSRIRCSPLGAWPCIEGEGGGDFLPFDVRPGQFVLVITPQEDQVR